MRASKNLSAGVKYSAPLMVALLVGSPLTVFGQGGAAELTEQPTVEIVKGKTPVATETAETVPTDSQSKDSGSGTAKMRITEYNVPIKTESETDNSPIPMKLYAHPQIETVEKNQSSAPATPAKSTPVSTTIMMPVAPLVNAPASGPTAVKATPPVTVRPKIASATPSEPPSKGTPDFAGKAAFYSSDLHGKKTASGQKYDEGGLTAAHKQLPFGTKVTVVNRKNGKQCTLTINDRGPYCQNHVIDVSKEAAKQLGLMQDSHRMVDCFIKIDAKDLIRRETKKSPAAKPVGESL